MRYSSLVSVVHQLAVEAREVTIGLSGLMLINALVTPSHAASVSNPQQSIAERPLRLAQDITASPDGTGTVVNQTGDTFDITGGTRAGDNLFHSFEQFGLDAEQAANIFSNPDIVNILGRVVGGDPSVIDGLLQVTGGDSNLFLINPAGIIFGPDAQVIMPAAFTATTADAVQFEDHWFNAVGTNDYSSLEGNPNGFAFVAAEPGTVINAGRLTTSPGEGVTLLGGTVINTGTIEAPGGTISITAVPGENLIRISEEGNLLSLELPIQVQATINTDPIALTATDIPTLLSGGTPQNLGVVVEEGVVKLVSTNTPIPTNAGTAIVSGNLDAADTAMGGIGGEIDVLGDLVGLMDTTLDASGSQGGGRVRIGGEYQGQGPIPNANLTFVGEGARIATDALTNGDGGSVIVWADGTTQFFGDITARGGSEAGDGGFAEVSGRDSLSFDGMVNLTSPTGVQGQLLLDPDRVTIGETGANDSDFDGTILAGETPETATISAGRIVELLNTTDVSIEADNTIEVNSRIEAEVSNSSNLTLTVNNELPNSHIAISEDIILRDGDLTLNGAVRISSSSGSPLLSGNNFLLNGNVRPQGSDSISFQIDATGDIVAQGEIGGGENNFSSIRFNNPFLVDNRGKVDLQSISPTSSIVIVANESINIESVDNADEIDLRSISAGINLQSISATLSIEQLIANGNINIESSGDIEFSSQEASIRSNGYISLNASGDIEFSNQEASIRSNEYISLNASGDIFLEKSQLELQGPAQFSSDNIQMTYSTIDAADGLTLQASEILSVTDSLNEGESVLRSEGNMVLQGAEGIIFDALNRPESVFTTNGDLSLISNGDIVGNGRFSANRDVRISTLVDSPGNFVYSPTSSAGIISAEGDVSFGNYTGPALKIEATGSITGGDITITEANAELTGSDPDIATLVSSPALILRAGVRPYELIENSLPSGNTARNEPNLSVDSSSFPLQGNTFEYDGTADTLANVTVGSIDTSNNVSESGGGGTVIIEAPGDISVGNIETTGSFSGDTGTVSLISGGSISLITEENVSASIITNERSIELIANDSITTGSLDTTDFGGDSSVTLLARTGDIQVGFIDAGSGGIDVNAAGSFRAIDSFSSISFQGTIVNHPELVNFLVRQGYDKDEVLNGKVQLSDFQLQVSLFARPDTDLFSGGIYNAPITINYGGATREIVNQEFTIFSNSGLPASPSRIFIAGDDSQPFVIGPESIEFVPFVPFGDEDLTPNLDPYNPIENPNGFDPATPFGFTTGESTPYTFPSSIFSPDINGLVAGIIVGTGANTTIHGSLQNRVFEAPMSSPDISFPPPPPPENVPPSSPPESVPPSSPAGMDLSVRGDIPGGVQNLGAEGSPDLCRDTWEEDFLSEPILTIDASILNEVKPVTGTFLIDPCDTRESIDEADNLSEAIDDSVIDLPE